MVCLVAICGWLFGFCLLVCVSSLVFRVVLLGVWYCDGVIAFGGGFAW